MPFNIWKTLQSNAGWVLMSLNKTPISKHKEVSSLPNASHTLAIHMPQ